MSERDLFSVLKTGSQPLSASFAFADVRPSVSPDQPDAPELPFKKLQSAAERSDLRERDPITSYYERYQLLRSNNSDNPQYAGPDKLPGPDRVPEPTTPPPDSDISPRPSPEPEPRPGPRPRPRPPGPRPGPRPQPEPGPYQPQPGPCPGPGP